MFFHWFTIHRKIYYKNSIQQCIKFDTFGGSCFCSSVVAHKNMSYPICLCLILNWDRQRNCVRKEIYCMLSVDANRFVKWTEFKFEREKKSVDFAGDTYGRNARTVKWVPVFGFYVYWQRCAKSRHTAYARILHGTIFFFVPTNICSFLHRCLASSHSFSPHCTCSIDKMVWEVH